MSYMFGLLIAIFALMGWLYYLDTQHAMQAEVLASMPPPTHLPVGYRSIARAPMYVTDREGDTLKAVVHITIDDGVMRTSHTYRILTKNERKILWRGLHD